MGTTLPGWQREPLATRASYTHTQEPVTAAGYTGATPGLTGTAPQERRAEHVPHAPVCVSTVPVAQGRNRPPAGARNHFAPGGSLSPAGSCIVSGVPPRHRRASPVPCGISSREVHGHWPGEGAGRGCCTVTGRGRVQARGAAWSLAGGGCRWGCWRAQGAAVTHFQAG
ncbi:unnamed protein product [Eretmochelys imbricata]